MAPVTRSLSLTVLAILSLSSRALASPSLPSSDLVFDSQLATEGIFDSAQHTLDDELLPPPEAADYDLLSEDERAAIFERTIPSPSAAVWHNHSKRTLSKAWSGKSTFSRAGYTGVGAMQVSLVTVRPSFTSPSSLPYGPLPTASSTVPTFTLKAADELLAVQDNHILIYDKAENNALKAKNGGSAWGSIYNIRKKTVRPLNLTTNSFCAGGGWLSNGTMVRRFFEALLSSLFSRLTLPSTGQHRR